MPTYSYYCPTHGEFETIRKISERENAPCKDCGKISTKLVDAPSGIQDGYYNQNMSINRVKQPFRTAHR
ncbi:TPA: zinc ribbon domain-containing protein [Klebsiella quasipneumoniae subsp. similipneumoniae]|uniref:zinc ribbon domain-containing protein n=1 Tax=Klebsiella quasipneumoniae TaxID=1463165 RepID=UPI000E3E2335|nr:zinc ribbon domain-containing protein [Klebsiella quasipneumoniae]HDH1381963.1 zinc ribbon domain-containing protein [Klebsiella quasipneumoniae subsp. similipneumoniae]HDU4851322.1 zinc ribbon domain-containing protein [Klebsiella quasipneumoniae subsp. similipneumoniae]